jgi:hypothetical protein
MSGTARLQLPLLSTGQAQKEATVNEALQTLDVLTAGAVEEGPRNDPPATPEIGSSYIIGSSPTGDWAGKGQFLAAFTRGGWRLLPPVPGMTVYVKADNQSANYRVGTWEMGIIRGTSVVLDGKQVVGGQAAAIVDPTAGTTIDAEARAAIGQMLSAMRQHGLIAIE